MDYAALSTPDTLTQTVTALTAKGIQATIVPSKEAALTLVQTLIPKGASVMNGASITLEQIGFVDHLKAGSHGWNNLHEAIVNENDPATQAMLRQQAVHAEYYLGSVHAITTQGDLVIASNTGSQLPHIVFTSKHLIFVIGAQKIVPTLTEAFDRLNSYVIPKEDVHMQEKYGVHTAANKVVVFQGENPMMGRSVHVIFVNEPLGF